MSLLIREGLVSVIVPAFSSLKMTIDMIDTVLKQTYRPIEVIVIANEADKETSTTLTDFAKRYSEIRVFNQQKFSMSAAYELGRLNAKGEFVQYCGSGQRLFSEKIACQVQALQNNPTQDIAYCGAERHCVGESDVAIGHDHIAMFPSILRQRIWLTSVPLYRRKIIDQIGPWFDVAHDAVWEYECRIASHSGRLTFVDYVGVAMPSGDHDVDDAGQAHQVELEHRCLVRAKIFRHAQAYTQLDDRLTEIASDDWLFFSESAFKLGHQCALAGLNAEARAMLSLSIEAVGKKTPQHRLYLFFVKWFGWKKAAQMHTALPR